MSLKSRVQQLARRVPVRRPFRRWVWIESGDGPAISYGLGGGLRLRVPKTPANRRDPEAALTDEQRALIRPGDRRLIIRCSTYRAEDRPETVGG